jgi:hypothetical protein
MLLYVIGLYLVLYTLVVYLFELDINAKYIRASMCNIQLTRL